MSNPDGSVGVDENGESEVDGDKDTAGGEEGGTRVTTKERII